MTLKRLELSGFKSFPKKSTLEFDGVSITAIVGPNGSGKSNIVESIRFVIGEQSMKSLRGKSGADLIFKGSQSLSTQNRAVVSIVFDNRDKLFKLDRGDKEALHLDYDEIIIKREVHRDGINNYFINNTEVRLKDILELLAGVNIGSSGHHIISQGETDRILSASLKERKELIEDALGLRIFKWRLRESERKLEKTRQNVREADLLRKEIAPQLRFLKRQVKKIEDAHNFKAELETLYEEDPEDKLREIRSTRDDLSRNLGRMEGMLEVEEKNVSLNARPPHAISFKKVESFVNDLKEHIDKTLAKSNIKEIIHALENIKKLATQFIKGESQTEYLKLEELDKLRQTKDSILRELDILSDKEKELEVRRKKIERIKIKLEDMGVGDQTEVMKEYEDLIERDQFLTRELEDLTKSMEALKNLMKELQNTIDEEFNSGLKKINVQFNDFFQLIFGGGNASLSLDRIPDAKHKRLPTGEAGKTDADEELIEVEEEKAGIEEEREEELGVNINVLLPRKRAKDLHMLSGGERSLTSIALLFSITQVNPPPFLVLDETDAALDEVNSRKYGDMLERLAKSSQLILVTHNRETMSRAHVLYGVTIGADGASKLLSVKLDEAVSIAK